MADKQDEELLLTPEEISDAKADAVLSWIESNKPSPRDLAMFVFSDEYEALKDAFLLKAQLAKVLKHSLDRPELREKIAITKLCDDYGMTENAMKFCIKEDKIRQHHIDSAYKFADQILALIPDEEEMREEIEDVKLEIKNLIKKLDDREEDLIEAKREERERIIKEVDGLLNISSVGGKNLWLNAKKWQALKENDV